MSPTGATASTVAPWSLAPWSLTPWRLAPWRLTPSRSTFPRSAPRRLTPPRLTSPPRSAPRRLTSRRSAFPRSTPRRLTSPRLEPRRLTSPRSAFRRLTFRRSTFARSAPRRLMSSRLEPRRSAPPRMAPRRLMSPRLRPRRSASRRLAPWFTAISRASRHDGASIENNSAVFNNRLRISILMAAPPSSGASTAWTALSRHLLIVELPQLALVDVVRAPSLPNAADPPVAVARRALADDDHTARHLVPPPLAGADRDVVGPHVSTRR